MGGTVELSRTSVLSTRGVLSRRSVLLGAAGAAVLTAVAGRGALTFGWVAGGKDGFAVLENLVRADFESARGSTARLTGTQGGGAIDVELSAVVDTGPDRERQFAVHFRPAGQPPGQDLYQVDHPSLGRFPLLLVPVRTGSGTVLEAVIDRTVRT